MSPAIARTSDTDIVKAARRLIAARGVEAVTLADVAAAVGIRAPSLYKRFTNREALLLAVKNGVLAELHHDLEAAVGGRTRLEAVDEMARVYRARALQDPHLYRLIHMPQLKTPDLEAERRAAAPALALMEDVVGPDHALHGARCFTSLLHGFVTMEIDGSFGFGGSVDEAFDFALAALLAGLQARA